MDRLVEAQDVMTENEVLESVLKCAREQAGSWLVYHATDARRSEPGYVDLTMIETRYPYRVLFVELKTQTGKLIKGRTAKQTGRRLPGQEEWGDAIKRSAEACVQMDWVEEYRGGEPRPGVYYYLVRPSDLERFYAVLLGTA